MWKVGLFGVILLAFLLRFIAVGQNPVSLYWDEVAIGYNAWSILETGKDEYGKTLPILFESFNEFKLPGYIYSVVPSIALFGRTPLAVRLPAVLYGTLTVLALYWLVYTLTRKKHISLLAALLLSINPWHVHMSRVGFEAIGMVFWVVLGFTFLVKTSRHPRWLLAAIVSLSISLYFYHAARMFVPLVLIVFFVCDIRTWWKRRTVVSIAAVIGLLMILPLTIESIKPGRIVRFEQVSVFSDTVLLEPSIAKIESDGRSFLSRAIHHRFLVYGQAVGESYLRHFSPGFLFFSGDPNARHSLPGMGMLYIFDLPFLLLGLLVLFQKKIVEKQLLFAWIVLAPLAAAITLPTPHALRAILLAPGLMILTAFGIVRFLQLLKTFRYALAVFGGVVILGVYGVSLVIFLEDYIRHYPQASARAWGDGYPQLFAWLREHQDEYETIAITGAHWKPYIFTLFYLPVPPSTYLDQPTNHSRYGKFFFGPSGWDQGDPYYQPDFDWEKLIHEAGTLAILAPHEAAQFKERQRLTEITRTDGSVAFVVLQS